MNSQHIIPSSIAFEFSHTDLELAGISGSSLTFKQALMLLRSKTAYSERELDGVQFEIFCGKSSLLMFAHLCTGEEHFFAFASLENLLDAISNATSPLASALFQNENGYILSVKPPRAAKVPAAFYEFGTKLQMHPQIVLHLREQALELISFNAVSKLRKTFSL